MNPRQIAVKPYEKMKRFYWAAALMADIMFYGLSIVLILVSAALAAKPAFLAGQTPDWGSGQASNFAWAVAVLTAINTLVPWRQKGNDYGEAREILDNSINLYNDDPTVPLKKVVDDAVRAANIIRGHTRKP